MFQPRLKLIPETDGQFSLLADTPVPNSFYTAGKVSKGAPKNLDVGAHVVAVTLPLKYRQKADAGEARTLFHRAFDLDLEAGTVLKAYVTLDGKVLGEGSMILAEQNGRLVGLPDGAAPASLLSPAALPGVELSIELCRALVVQASFNPERFHDLTQQLRELGVIDDKRAKAHKDRIRKRLIQSGFDIDPDEISSGPVVTVDRCADSVFNNATT
jgi:hypothetical protein